MNKIYAGAQRFLSDYFGFEKRRIYVHGVKMDKRGEISRIQFEVRCTLADPPAAWLAVCREADWELIRLPVK